MRVQKFNDMSLIPSDWEFTEEIEGDEEFIGIFDGTNNLVSYIAYIELDTSIHILYAECDPRHRRAGLTERLIKEVASMFPGMPTYMVAGTSKGEKFIDSLVDKGIISENRSGVDCVYHGYLCRKEAV